MAEESENDKYVACGEIQMRHAGGTSESSHFRVYWSFICFLSEHKTQTRLTGFFFQTAEQAICRIMKILLWITMTSMHTGK